YGRAVRCTRSPDKAAGRIRDRTAKIGATRPGCAALARATHDVGRRAHPRLVASRTAPMPPSTNSAETAARALTCSPRTTTPRTALITGTDSCTALALIEARRTRTQYQMT